MSTLLHVTNSHPVLNEDFPHARCPAWHFLSIISFVISLWGNVVVYVILHNVQYCHRAISQMNKLRRREIRVPGTHS